MGWGLFILEDVQVEEPLLPFTSPYYTISEYKKLSPYYPRVKCYVLNGHDKFFIDNDVEKGNVAGILIALPITAWKLQNCLWEYNRTQTMG
jgi:hypothetical protein